MIRTIGQGTFGKVKLARDVATGRTVAMKSILKKNVKTAKQMNSVQREVRLMKLLQHEHIVQVYETLETPDNIYIVMEHASGGELFDFIVTNGNTSEQTARHFFRQVVAAIDYCHKNSIIHRDLKPENLLLDDNGNIKIIDFGFGNTFHRDRTLDTYCGSPFYAAPEMVKGTPYIGPEVDIWSLGVILYALLNGRLPFDTKEMSVLYAMIAKGAYAPMQVSPAAENLIQMMLTVNPICRAKMHEIIDHPWTNIGYPHKVDSRVPARPAIVAQPDPAALAELQTYGISERETRRLLSLDCGLHPIKSLYFLVADHLARQRRAAAGSAVACAGAGGSRAAWRGAGGEAGCEGDEDDEEGGEGGAAAGVRRRRAGVFERPPGLTGAVRCETMVGAAGEGGCGEWVADRGVAAATPMAARGDGHLRGGHSPAHEYLDALAAQHWTHHGRALAAAAAGGGGGCGGFRAGAACCEAGAGAAGCCPRAQSSPGLDGCGDGGAGYGELPWRGGVATQKGEDGRDGGGSAGRAGPSRAGTLDGSMHEENGATGWEVGSEWGDECDEVARGLGRRTVVGAGAGVGSAAGGATAAAAPAVTTSASSWRSGRESVASSAGSDSRDRGGAGEGSALTPRAPRWPAGFWFAGRRRFASNEGGDGEERDGAAGRGGGSGGVGGELPWTPPGRPRSDRRASENSSRRVSTTAAVMSLFSRRK